VKTNRENNREFISSTDIVKFYRHYLSWK